MPKGWHLPESLTTEATCAHASATSFSLKSSALISLNFRCEGQVVTHEDLLQH